ncbi:hypothetical protein AAP_02968 [Ascosphaera apis ARSEF 7405]|uniref:Uncharacterized protein n=1 Tax=Ascosphaera apis ARSEF 7405 TaxID=392613 RepID=A0A162IEM2_9EURO|nr:hypothetical protein AAP_02968 [Ascosphaera apis ARSEF 7405]
MAPLENNGFLDDLPEDVQFFRYEGPDSIASHLFHEWKAGKYAVVFNNLTEDDLDNVDKGRERLFREVPSFGQVDFSRRSNELIIKIPSKVQQVVRDCMVNYILGNLKSMKLDQLVSSSASMSFRTSQRIKEPCQALWLKDTESEDMIEFPSIVFETGLTEARPMRDVMWWLNVSDDKVRMAVTIVHDRKVVDSQGNNFIEVITWTRGEGIGLLRHPAEVQRVRITKCGDDVSVKGPKIAMPLWHILGRPAKKREYDIIFKHDVFREIGRLAFDLPKKEPTVKTKQ